MWANSVRGVGWGNPTPSLGWGGGAHPGSPPPSSGWGGGAHPHLWGGVGELIPIFGVAWGSQPTPTFGVRWGSPPSGWVGGTHSHLQCGRDIESVGPHITSECPEWLSVSILLIPPLQTPYPAAIIVTLT